MASNPRTARTAEALLTPAPLSSLFPSLVVIPSTICLRLIVSVSFLKPKVRRMM